MARPWVQGGAEHTGREGAQKLTDKRRRKRKGPGYPDCACSERWMKSRRPAGPRLHRLEWMGAWLSRWGMRSGGNWGHWPWTSRTLLSEGLGERLLPALPYFMLCLKMPGLEVQWGLKSSPISSPCWALLWHSMDPEGIPSSNLHKNTIWASRVPQMDHARDLQSTSSLF